MNDLTPILECVTPYSGVRAADCPPSGRPPWMQSCPPCPPCYPNSPDTDVFSPCKPDYDGSKSRCVPDCTPCVPDVYCRPDEVKGS
jgi:hypothetical protein